MKKPIDEIIPISLPVGAGFMGSVFGYACKQLGTPKNTPISIGQMEAVRRALGVLESIIKGELEVEKP